jgi:hypothetical protein
MKLFAASATLLAAVNAQSIDMLVMELVNKVYQVSDDGLTHTINAAPYLQGTYTCLGDGFTSDVNIGNGNGVMHYTEKADWSSGDSFSYEYAVEGTAKSHPLANVMFPAEVMEDKFTQQHNIELGFSGLVYKSSGSVNGVPFTSEISVGMGEMSQTSKKMSAQFEISQAASTPSSINAYWRSWMCPTGSANFVIVASGKNACMESPMQKSCTAKLVITGNKNGEDLGKNVAKYTVQPKKAQIAVTHNGAEVFWIGLTGINDLEVLAIKYKLNGGKAILVVQMVGPAGMEAVAVAAEEFITPFLAFFGSMQSGDDFVRAAVYSDKVFTAAQGKNYFNFYPIVGATKFESDLLAGVLGSSFQTFAASMCEQINMTIEGGLNEVAPVVSGARTYVNAITGSEGETKFDAWFAQF